MARSILERIVISRSPQFNLLINQTSPEIEHWEADESEIADGRLRRSAIETELL
jgi:hypothetical protein